MRKLIEGVCTLLYALEASNSNLSALTMKILAQNFNIFPRLLHLIPGGLTTSSFLIRYSKINPNS